MLRKSTNQLSIKPKMSDSVKLTIVCVTTVLMAVAFYAVYHFGVRAGHAQYEQDRTVISQLNETVKGVRRELSEAEQNMIFAQRQQQIQQEAYKQMSSAYASSEQKNRYLGSRLDFYRSIISPEDGQSGPSIQGLDYRLEEGQILFDIILVQAIKHKHQVRGTLTAQLYLGDNVIGQWPDSSPRSVSYQYFQQVSGVIESDQVSENARIKIKLDLSDGAFIERWFNIKSEIKAQS